MHYIVAIDVDSSVVIVIHHKDSFIIIDYYYYNYYNYLYCGKSQKNASYRTWRLNTKLKSSCYFNFVVYVLYLLSFV